MDKLKTVRGLFKAGHVLLKISEIFSLIAVIGMLIGLFCLTILPADAVDVLTKTDVSVSVNMARWIGKDAWLEARDTVKNSIQSKDGETVTVTDEGLVVEAGQEKNITRGDLALSMAPAILQFAVVWFFCRTLGKALKGVGKGGEIFTRENAAALRTSAIALFVLAVAPYAVFTIVGLFASLSVSVDINFVTVFAGLMLMALAYLFEYEADRRPIAPASAPFSGYSGFSGAVPPAGESGEKKPDDASDPRDPNAF